MQTIVYNKDNKNIMYIVNNVKEIKGNNITGENCAYSGLDLNILGIITVDDNTVIDNQDGTFTPSQIDTAWVDKSNQILSSGQILSQTIAQLTLENADLKTQLQTLAQTIVQMQLGGV
jgi:transposase